MTKRKKPNPFNSGCLQAFLDVRAAIERMDLGLTDINDIIADMQQDESELRNTSDEINHSHEYPDKSIGFSQTARYDDRALFYELPRGEQALFNLMCDIQDPQTGFVTVIKGIFVEVLRFTNTERKNMQGYLDDLTEKGFLSCNYRPTNKKPGEYKINQAISWIGKRDKPELDKLQEFETKYTIGKDTVVLPDGRKVNSGKLILIDKAGIQKNGVSAGHTDTTTEPCTGSEPQDDSNRNEVKKQVSDTVNMPKNENILTPEEELIFSGTLREGDRV